MKKAIVILKHRWKHKFIRDFFSEYDEVVVNLDCRLLSYTSDVDFFFWASDIDNDFYKHYAQHDNVYLMEDGFFRSVGLGADHMRPLSLVFDQSGIYYDSSCPSDLELILTSLDLDCYLKKQSLDLIESINRLKVNKYNLVSDQEISFNTDRSKLLVVGQVENDQSILRGSKFFKTNHQLLKHVRSHNPDAFIIFKPHPDTLFGGRAGKVDDSSLYDVMITDVSMLDLFDHVNEVHTITSLAGFEAILRNKTVYTYGMPFYAGWGLTKDFYTCSRRSRILDIETLVYGALVAYPKYVNIDGKTSNVQEIINLLSLTEYSTPLSIHFLRFKRNFLKMLGFKF